MLIFLSSQLLDDKMKHSQFKSGKYLKHLKAGILLSAVKAKDLKEQWYPCVFKCEREGEHRYVTIGQDSSFWQESETNPTSD